MTLSVRDAVVSPACPITLLRLSENVLILLLLNVLMYSRNAILAQSLSILGFRESKWQQLGFEQVKQFVKVGTKEEFVIMTCAISSLSTRF